MTTNEIEKYLREHPDKEYIIEDIDEYAPGVKYVKLKYGLETDTILQSPWFPIRFARTRSPIMKNVWGNKDAEWRKNNFRILSDEEVTLALL